MVDLRRPTPCLTRPKPCRRKCWLPPPNTPLHIVNDHSQIKVLSAGEGGSKLNAKDQHRKTPTDKNLHLEPPHLLDKNFPMIPVPVP